jgi:glutathione S-transferase
VRLKAQRILYTGEVSTDFIHLWSSLLLPISRRLQVLEISRTRAATFLTVCFLSLSSSMPTVLSTHILYYFQYSIRSLFVRYAYALRGLAADPSVEIHLEEQHIDLRPPGFDQLTEPFICDINPSGEVPVLVSKQDGRILPDSRNITFKIAEYYPQLMPEQHVATIHRLLAELHAIDFYSLTFTGKYMFPCGTIATLLERRNSPETSDRYREVLDRKIDQ